MATLTPWFPGDVQPARDGVYLRNLSGMCFHSRFVAGRWRRGSIAKTIFKPHPDVAREVLESRHQQAAWCGLAQNSLQS